MGKLKNNRNEEKTNLLNESITKDLSENEHKKRKGKRKHTNEVLEFCTQTELSIHEDKLPHKKKKTKNADNILAYSVE